MPGIKIGIVEDEMLIALSITEALKELGYEVTEVANNYTQAIEMIANERPDILLLDIQLSGHKDGIDVAEKVNRDFKIPFIFLTANSDMATVERAKNVSPQGYLVKPFRKNELYTSIEVCMHNYTSQRKQEYQPQPGNYMINDSLFIKQGQQFHKVKIDDIMYLESDGVYLNVYTLHSKLLVRSNLQDYLELIGAKYIFRVHRSYAVNINHIEDINNEMLMIRKEEIPISKSYRDQLFNALKLG